MHTYVSFFRFASRPSMWVGLASRQSAEELNRREVELGSHIRMDCGFVFPLRFSSAVAFWTLSLWLCSAQLLKQQPAYTSRLALASSRLFNIVILPVAASLFGALGRAIHLYPMPPFPPSLIILMVSVDVMHHERRRPGGKACISRLISIRFRWEQVWPSGKAGKQKDLGSNPLRLSFLFKRCGLWTLFCDFVPHN